MYQSAADVDVCIDCFLDINNLVCVNGASYLLGLRKDSGEFDENHWPPPLL